MASVNDTPLTPLRPSDSLIKRKEQIRHKNMGLKEYQGKRNFSKTPEPHGDVVDTGKSRFVVHRHDASHLHFDFRLEMDGMLKSWAVPKGLPEEPGVRRLAVQVEDHPLSYIDFKGTIPEGQYGAGTVEIWDNGQYVLEKKMEKQIEFTLNGKRFTGGYALIHTQGKNWIFIKRLPK
jgi:bifunctional non-homologous end joining protein LigD